MHTVRIMELSDKNVMQYLSMDEDMQKVVP